MADEQPKKITAEQMYALAQSMDASLKLLVAHFGAGGKPQGASASVAGERSASPRVASDRDLDSQYGDPEIKSKDPRDWTGAPMKGKHFSECPAEYLDLFADRMDFFIEQGQSDLEDPANDANHAEIRKKMKYNRLDASRARGWAQRKRNGWTAPPPPEGFPSDAPPAFDDDNIAF